MRIKDIEIFLEIFAESKNSLKENEIKSSIEILKNLIEAINFTKENEENYTNDYDSNSNNIINNSIKDSFFQDEKNLKKIFDDFFLKEKSEIKNNLMTHKFNNEIKNIKFKANQLLKFLKLKGILTKHALDIDLREFDYENLNPSTIIEIFILKKYNIELITDITDFFNKTTDIREAFGLNTDEYLIELSGIFQKYKMLKMCGEILNVFYEKNYNTFERCLLSMKKDKSFNLLDFINQNGNNFTQKILENSTNVNLIININEYLGQKNNLTEENFLEFCQKAKNQKNSEKKIKNLKENIQPEKPEFFSYITYSEEYKNSNLNNSFNLKNEFNFQKEFIKEFNPENSFKENFESAIKLISQNFDEEKKTSNEISAQSDTNENNTYSLHPKLMNLLTTIGYEFRGKEFKINTNLKLKSKLYRNLLEKKFCIIENILQWENFSYDLSNVKNFKFLEEDFTQCEIKEIKEENFLIIKNEDQKFFEIFNLLSLLYENDEKFVMILSNITEKILKKIEENYFLKGKKSEDFFDFLEKIKKNLELFFVDCVYYVIKNTGTFTFINLKFWRNFWKIFIEKIRVCGKSEPNKEKFFSSLEEKVIEIEKNFCFFNLRKNKNKELDDKFIEKSDFVMKSLFRIANDFNVLFLFGPEFFLNFDYGRRIKNIIFNEEIKEFSLKFAFFRNFNFEKKVQKNESNKDIYYKEFYLIYLIELFKNFNLNNIFSLEKILSEEILSKYFYLNNIEKALNLPEKISIINLLSIKLINNSANLSSFISLKNQGFVTLLNFIKTNTKSETQFKQIINEILFTPKFTILLDSIKNIILLERNINFIIRDYYQNKINIFTQIKKLLEIFKISPIAETKFKLLEIKKFICDSYTGNLRNLYGEISEIEDYYQLENLAKDERTKKEMYNIYIS